MALDEKLRNLPTVPGCYLHKNAKGEIIYVGKARNRRNRLRRYFQNSRAIDAKTLELVARRSYNAPAVRRNEGVIWRYGSRQIPALETPPPNEYPPSEYPVDGSMKTFLATLFAIFIFLSSHAVANAQTTPPASDDEQDFIVPARPTFSNPAEFQKPGVLQLEYGYNANFHAPGVSVAQDTPLALRFAASSRLLLELDSDLVISQSLPGSVRATGFGDMQLGVQGVLEHEKESRPGIAVAYYIKLPTASSSKGLGTGRVDHNFVALVSKKFGQTVIDFNAIYLLAGSAIERGHASSAQGAIAFSRNLTRRTGVQGEVSGISRNDLQPGAVVGLGVVTYQVNRRLVFDGGARFGITHDAPRAGLVAGLTVGVSDLYRNNKK